jgi:hypothetical protein
MLQLTERTLDLGKDGAKWKHGYIPLNAAAFALKDHKAVGHIGSVNSKGSLKLRNPRVRERAIKLGADRTKWTTPQLRLAAKDGDSKAALALGTRHPRSPIAAKPKPLKLTSDIAPRGRPTRRAVPKDRTKEDDLETKVKKLKLVENAPKTAPKEDEPEKIRRIAQSTNDLQKELPKAIAAGDKVRAQQIKTELVKRQAAVRDLLRQQKEARAFIAEELPKVEDPAKDDGKSMNKFMRGLVKIMPSLKPKLDKIRNSKASKKLKDVKYFEAIVDAVFETLSDKIIGGVITAGLSYAGIKFGAGG